MMARCAVVALVIVAAVCTCEAAVRGVSPTKGASYQEGTPFQCLDGSGTIEFVQVNDDYCDCMDGSDEPGTSACSNGKFFCENLGHRGEHILSSRVNDGVCDCCDGSDEYLGYVTCENKCDEVGRAARRALAEEKEKQLKGFELKKVYVIEARQAHLADQTRLVELEKQLASAKEVLATMEAQLTASEEPEKKAKEAFDKQWEDTLAERKKVGVDLLFSKLDIDQDGRITTEDLVVHLEFDADADGTVTKEEAEDILDEDGDGALTDDESFVDKDEFSDTKYEDWKKKFREEGASLAGTEDEPKPEYDESIQNLIRVADTARTANTAASESKKRVDDEINKINNKWNLDLGEEKEFAYLQGKCFEVKDREYTYEMCAFDKVTQKPGSGRSTNLGKWGKWVEENGNKHAKMVYENGEKCWNGPSRSMTVSIVCGVESKLVDVAEPSRCEYSVTFQTPAACGPPTAGTHDEL